MYVASLFAREPFALAPVSSLSRVSHCTLPGASVIRYTTFCARGVRRGHALKNWELLGSGLAEGRVREYVHSQNRPLIHAAAGRSREGDGELCRLALSPRRGARRRGGPRRLSGAQPLGGPGRRAPRGSPDATRSRRASRDRSRGARTGHRRGDARERRAGVRSPESQSDAPTDLREAHVGSPQSPHAKSQVHVIILSSSVLAGRSFSLPGPPPPSSPGAPMSHWRGMSPHLASRYALRFHCACAWRPTRYLTGAAPLKPPGQAPTSGGLPHKAVPQGPPRCTASLAPCPDAARPP